MSTILADLQAAANQLPDDAKPAEAKPLAEIQIKAARSRRHEPQELGAILVQVLARLGVTNPAPAINSTPLKAPVAEPRVSDR